MDLKFFQNILLIFISWAPNHSANLWIFKENITHSCITTKEVGEGLARLYLRRFPKG